MKILICGAGGQLGSDCTAVLNQKHDVIPASSKDLDISNLNAVEDLIHRRAPDIVLNCAAYTKVDACETEREQAWNINAEGPKNIALSVSRYGGKLLQISTDYVFDGKKEPPAAYAEDNETAPLSFYGRTKLEGELAVQQETDRYIIIRTAWLYGIKGQNFLKTMLKLSLKNPEKDIKVVNDQYGSPTWSYSLAKQVEKLIEINAQGIYHATSEGYCTWYELAEYFLDTIGVKHTVIPCSTEEYLVPAPRPRNSILENERLKKENMNLMPDWQDAINEFIGKFKNSLMNECNP
jgi:dTDP-4-dehydrorhamnose reductase